MRIHHDHVGLEVHVDGPDEAPPVLLLHGITSSARTWDWITPVLAERRRVVRLDFRGHGASDRTPDAYGLDGYVADAITACVEAVGRPTPVIGHSLGGVTAAALAQLRPDLVTGVLLEDPPLSATERFRGEAAGTDDANALLGAFTLMRQSIPGLQAAGTSVDDLVAILAAAPSPSGGTFGEVLLADGIRSMAEGMLAVDATVLVPVLAGTTSPMFDPGRPIEVPVTLVAADPECPDAVVTPSDVERLAVTSPHVRSHTVAGAGHMVHDTIVGRPAFEAIVAEFLDAG
jgi:pimeloyl-ACP methyl ester carboxylesterase